MTEAPEWLSSQAGSLTRRSIAFARTHLLAGLVVGVVVDGTLAWQGCYGVADVTTGRTLDDRTLFQIASITKTFTASAVVQLRDRGLLELDEPVVRHLPELATVGGLPYAPRISVRQLLQHSSGLQGNPPPGDPRSAPDLTQAEVIASLGQARVLTPPGTEFRYSNLGYRLLAEIVHRVDGRIWPDYARAELLGPLGMLDSGATPPEGTDRAQGHRAGTFSDRPVPVAAIDTALAMGDGDVWSSLRDLTEWVGEQLAPHMDRSPRVLSAESLLEMQAGTFVAAPDRSEARGLGWNTVQRGHGVLVSHGGSLDGYNTHVCFSPTARLGVVALTNGMPRASIGDLAWELADLLVAARSDAPREDALTTPTAPPEAYQALLGRYVDPVDGQELRIEYRAGQLAYVDPTGGGSGVLDPTEDPFVFLADRERWQFLRDDVGAVDCLNAHGYPLVKESA